MASGVLRVRWRERAAGAVGRVRKRAMVLPLLHTGIIAYGHNRNHPHPFLTFDETWPEYFGKLWQHVRDDEWDHSEYTALTGLAIMSLLLWCHICDYECPCFGLGQKPRRRGKRSRAPQKDT